MHDGSEKTLEDVVEFYDRGGNANPYLDEDMKPLKLTPQEKEDLIAFLKALTGEPRPVEVPTLPPGPDGKAPDARAALHAKVPGTAALSPDSAHEGIFLPTLRRHALSLLNSSTSLETARRALSAGLFHARISGLGWVTLLTVEVSDALLVKGI